MMGGACLLSGPCSIISLTNASKYVILCSSVVDDISQVCHELPLFFLLRVSSRSPSQIKKSVYRFARKYGLRVGKIEKRKGVRYSVVSDSVWSQSAVDYSTNMFTKKDHFSTTFPTVHFECDLLQIKPTNTNQYFMKALSLDIDPILGAIEKKNEYR